MPYEVYRVGGRRYFSGSFGTETQAARALVVYREGKDGNLVPAAAGGNAGAWSVLRRPEFQAVLPPGTKLDSNDPKDAVFFLWSDRNGDGVPEPEELRFRRAMTAGMTLEKDLMLVDGDLDGRVMGFAPVSFTADGVPMYGMEAGRVLAEQAQRPAGDGGGQVLVDEAGVVFTTATAPYAVQSISGVDRAGHRWSYPNLWPGLHPAHSAPVPSRPGELVGVTHLLGGFVTPKDSDTGPLFAVNGNFGPMYLMTADGLFVEQLFEDVRTGKPWKMATAEAGMLLDGVSPGDENFHPSMTQTEDGSVYVVSGKTVSLVRVEGLSSIRRMGAMPLHVGPEEVEAARSYQRVNEVARQQRRGAETVSIPTLAERPKVAGDLMKVPGLPWMTIAQRIEVHGFAQVPVVQEATAAIAGGRLYVGWRTGDAKVALNAGTVANAMFKTGGALDLMLGTDGAADETRSGPVAGDERLLVAVVNGRPRAVLYRAVVPGTREPVAFSSPDRTVTLDQVEDVSGEIEFSQNQGDYVISILLATLGLKPTPGMVVKADVGLLRGDGATTLERSYWNNKATGLVSDVPSEAELMPKLWGRWKF
jgi:hypothetical protein